MPRVSPKSVMPRVSPKSVMPRVFPRVSCQECHPRVSCQECQEDSCEYVGSWAASCLALTTKYRLRSTSSTSAQTQEYIIHIGPRFGLRWQSMPPKIIFGSVYRLRSTSQHRLKVWLDSERQWALAHYDTLSATAGGLVPSSLTSCHVSFPSIGFKVTSLSRGAAGSADMAPL
jgi:hypothetical protein